MTSLPSVPASSPAVPLWQMCATMLQDLCNLNRVREDSTDSGVFHSKSIPAISITDYMRRIYKYAKCTEECFLIMLVFVDRWSQMNRVPLTHRNVHRLVIAAMVVAIKTRDDLYYCMSYYSSIGGVSMVELSKLEVAFMKQLNWNLWIQPATYDKYFAACANRVTAVVNVEPTSTALPPLPTKYLSPENMACADPIMDDGVETY